jgi:NADPH2 dehydrogenase
MTDFPEIFAPLRIGSVELPSRVAVPPMVQVRPITSPEGIGWYRRMGACGAGMVIIEATGVPRFEQDLTVESLRPLVDAIHENGAAAAIQLFPLLFGGEAQVDELSLEEIDHILDQYGRAAAICAEAGFDAVEPHGAHGYLLNQFFMPDRNHRKDDYGGSLENRCRLGVRIVESIRKAAGDRLLILYRHSPRGEHYTLEDSLEFAERLVAAGVDADLAAPFKARLNVPVIAVGGMGEPVEAAEALREGRCDLIAVGRQMITDARWPQAVQEGHLDRILHCAKCNKGCFGNLKEGKPVACVLWEADEVAGYIH